MLDGTETHCVKKTRNLRRVFFRVLPAILSVSVAIATAYALIVPGLTMNMISSETSEETTVTDTSVPAESPVSETTYSSDETAASEQDTQVPPQDSESTQETTSETATQETAEETTETAAPSETTDTQEPTSTSESTQASETTESTVETAPSETTSTEATDTQETTSASDSTQASETTESTAETSSESSVPKASETKETMPQETTAESSAPTETTAETTVPSETVAEPQVFVFENEKIIVTATLDPQVILPEGAIFLASEISAATDPARYAKFVNLLSEDSEQVTESVPTGMGVYAYDIGFFVGGDEVEPEGGSVSVTITYKDAIIEVETPEDVSIFHVEESGTDMALEPVATEAPVVSDEGVVEEVSFEAQSFSPYLITNGYTMSSSLQYKLIDQQSETFTNTTYYNQASALDLAGSFHLVAFDTLNLNAHTNGNFCAKNVYATTNFGMNGYGAELSYVQNYLKVTSTDAADVQDILVVGSSNTVSLVDNGNSFAVNGTKIDKPYTIWQDNDTNAMPFVDLATVESGIKSVAAGLAAQPNVNFENHLVTYGDPYQSYLKITNVNEAAVFNMTSSQLESYANGFSIRGFAQNTVGTAILNIDCAGDSTVIVPKILMQIGSEMMNFSELTSFSSGKIILNFISSANANISLNLTYATVIAPDANINATQNVNGTIIGNNVTISAESHRNDFTGILPSPPTGSVSVTKAWKAFNGTALSGDALSDLSVQAQLYCDGVAMSGAEYLVTLDSSNYWTYKWQDLAISNGQVYTVKEKTISRNGVVIQTGDAAQSYEVTYTTGGDSKDKTIAISNRVITGNISVNKQWISLDGDPLTAEEVQDLSVEIQLCKNGTPMTGPEYLVTLSSLENWTHDWTSLPIGANETYSVQEVSILRTTEGVTEVIQAGSSHALYEVTYNNNAGITNGSIEVINRVNTGSVSVEKTWYDKDGYPMFGDQISSFSVTIQLYCNGEAMTDPQYTIELSTENNWTHTWMELPIDSGQLYTVVESNYGGFSVTYENNEGINNGTILVKNSRGHENVLPETGSIGTTGFYLTGATLTLVSLLLLSIQNRRHKKKRGELSG